MEVSFFWTSFLIMDFSDVLYQFSRFEIPHAILSIVFLKSTINTAFKQNKDLIINIIRRGPV